MYLDQGHASSRVPAMECNGVMIMFDVFPRFQDRMDSQTQATCRNWDGHWHHVRLQITYSLGLHVTVLFDEESNFVAC